jgi:hypothetical protein
VKVSKIVLQTLQCSPWSGNGEYDIELVEKGL